MERKQSYSSQQSKASFQPHSVQQRSPLENTTLKPLPLHSSSNPHPSLNSERPQAHTVHKGDTLWDIAQHQWGDGRRWHELQKPNGSHFTEQEAHKLQVGSSVYIPAQKATSAFHVKPYTDGFGRKPHEVTHQGGSDRVLNLQTSNHQLTRQAANYPKTTLPIATSTAKLAQADHPIVNHPSDLNKGVSGSKENDQTAGIAKGTAVGSSVASGKVPRLAQSVTSKEPYPSTSSSSSSLPLPKTWAEREQILGRVDKPSRNPARESAKGRIADTAWKEHLKARSDVAEVVSQPRWRDPRTGKPISFPDAKSRIPDFLVRLKNGTNHAYEIKATPSAAESPSAVKQRVRDRIALSKNAVLGKGKGPHVGVSHVATKVGLPILGPGGNSALPGGTQKHVIVKPRLDQVAHDAEHVHPDAVKGISEGVAKGVTKGVLRGASRAATPIAAAVDAYDLTKTYQQDGFGSKFRSKAAGVAGGWGGAALGAEGGAAIGTAIFPGVGTVVGGLIGGAGGYLVGSGAASKVEEGIESVAPKAWNGVKSVGSGIADGAKSAWHSINPFD